MKFRKKPIIIDAIQFKPWEDEIGAGHPNDELNGIVYGDPKSSTGWSCNTLEGKHEVTPDDWIITGVKGEKYPCKPDVFKKTYEKV